MWFRLLILGAGLLLGAVVIITIAETVSEFITKYNLPKLVRRALENSTEAKAKELLSGALEGKIHELDGNTISISLLDQNGTEALQVRLTTEAGISNVLAAGMAI